MITRAYLSNFGVGVLESAALCQHDQGRARRKRAIAILDLQSSPTCQTLHKLLRSAVANAEHNNQLASENLIVSNVLVDQGPTVKRIHPRARGRAYRIFKRSCHVTIELDLKQGLTLERLRGATEAARRAKHGAKRQSGARRRQGGGRQAGQEGRKE